MKSIPPRHRQNSSRSSLAAAAGAVLLLVSPQVAQAGPIALIANETGFVAYPSSTPDQIGNESNASFSDAHSVTQSGPLAAQLSETRSGTDSSSGSPGVGTSGTTTIAGSTVTEAGHIQAASSARVVSTGDSHSGAPYPHGTAAVEGFGKFSDSVMISNANYGAFVPVTIRMNLSWTHTYELGQDRASVDFMQDWAIAQMGLEQVGSITLYNLIRTDGGGYERIELEGSLSGFTYNNQWMSLFGSLDVQANASVNVHGTVSSPSAAAAAYSAAEAFYFIDAPTDSTLTSQSGHDYLYRAAQAVPDATSSLALLAGGVAALLAVARSRRVAPAAVAGV
ncbi:MAG: hypothetical protein NTV51_02595 [Verrucomicrobia bacterium]|nr:hypothetical protein [Verrucomicrobiota bacterium]